MVVKKQDSPEKENKKVAVVHIGPTPFFANRGCHIRILNEIRGLQTAGRRVILCTYGLGNTIDNVETRRIWSIPGYTKTGAGFSPYKFLADFLLFFLVLKTVWQENPRVIHGHLHEGGLIGWSVATVLFWRKIRVIMDIQGSLSGELEAYGTFKRFPALLKFFYFVERIISYMPDLIVCSSDASMVFLERQCRVEPSRLSLLGDVVPDSFFKLQEKESVRQTLGIPGDKDVVIYTGSLLSGKGVDILLDGLRTVARDNPSVFFILIGYPKGWVEQFAREHGLADMVKIPGEVDYRELADWLAAADIAVDPKLPGSGEASGKILHYMASGLAIVCFDSRNNRSLLDGHGFFADGDSAADLARAIELALTDRPTRNKYGPVCREKAQTCFSLEATGKQLESIYAGIERGEGKA